MTIIQQTILFIILTFLIRKYNSSFEVISESEKLVSSYYCINGEVPILRGGSDSKFEILDDKTCVF